MWCCGKQNSPETVLTVAWKVTKLGKLAVLWSPAFSAGYDQVLLTAAFDWTRLIFTPVWVHWCLWGYVVRNSCVGVNQLPLLSFSLALPPERALCQVNIWSLFIQSLPENMYLSDLVGIQLGNLLLYNKKGVWGSSDLQTVGSVYDLGVRFGWAGYLAFRKVVSLNEVFSLDTKKQRECLCLYFWIKIPIEYNQCTLHGLLFVYFFKTFVLRLLRAVRLQCWYSSCMFSSCLVRVNLMHYHNKYILKGMQERKIRKKDD